MLATSHTLPRYGTDGRPPVDKCQVRKAFSCKAVVLAAGWPRRRAAVAAATRYSEGRPQVYRSGRRGERYGITRVRASPVPAPERRALPLAVSPGRHSPARGPAHTNNLPAARPDACPCSRTPQPSIVAVAPVPRPFRSGVSCRCTPATLTSAGRHGAAHPCTVRLMLDDPLASAGLLLAVVDDGGGLPSERTHGVGLASLRERATELGGNCTIERQPAGGTRVRVRLPLGESAAGGRDAERDEGRTLSHPSPSASRPRTGRSRNHYASPSPTTIRSFAMGCGPCSARHPMSR